MIVSFARRKDAFVMMSKFDEVYSVALAVVGVHFLTPLQIVQANTEILTSSDQIFSIVANIN